MIPDYPTPDLSVPLRSLFKTAFGDDDVFLDHFFSAGFSPDRCRCIVSEEGKLLSALYWFDTEYQGESFAYLYGIATDPAFRHQGILRYLLADTLQLLKGRDYAGAQLVPGDDQLRQMYTAMGFADCSSYSVVLSASKPVTVPIHAIDRQEYGKLRRTYLPKNGVIQEGENLRFLETQCKFYTGPGFLMCAAPKTETFLEVPEYLGNTEIIPGVLCALGYPMGSFRVPGNTSPFAMVCPLKKDAPIPGYFGLAFD